ncbi:hypothetical protein OVY01_16075 [Robbsia sp. Bb-Pol-6]|uniref:Uncharacterized protein n=1 Tax=Robbsia betulipollinis TaxID=2981849 RepID=A0ABT3ZQ52_9BURK|nr:hypothetical protein [Robbsia betulipollinis]MCY0388694.1 hypothetical protein [Robbsia betulipollinis]
MRALTFGAKVDLISDGLALNALNGSGKLNRLLDKVTKSRVNREVIAQRVWHTALDLLQDVPIAAKSLGERSAALVPLLTTALIKGNQEEMHQAITELIRIGMDGALGVDAHGEAPSGVKHALAHVLGDAAAAISTKLADSYLGAHAGEKILATMVARHGWAPIKTRLKQALGTTFGKGFLIRQIKGVLDPAVIKKPGMNQEASPEYRLLADLAHIGVTGGSRDAMLARLQDYVPKSFAAVQLASAGWQATQALAGTVAAGIDQARATVNDTAHMVKEAVPTLLHTIQTKTGIGLQPRMLDEAYAANAHAARAGVAASSASVSFPVDVQDRQIADAYLTQLVVARAADDPASGTTRPERADASTTAAMAMAAAQVRLGLREIAQETPQRFDETQRLLDTLSPQQIAPLGERSDIAVVKMLTGQLTQIEANSHRWLANDVALNRAIEDGLAQLPGDTTFLGNYQVGSAFAMQHNALDLSLPASEYGYADAAWNGGMAAMNTGWGMLGFRTDTLSADSSALLTQLYNTCGRDEGIMQEATRYLDVPGTHSAMAAAVLARFATPQTGPPLIGTGEGFVQLAGREPQTRFKMTHDASMVTLSVEARWPVVAFGPAPDAMRVPAGQANKSAMTTASAVTIRRLPDGRGLSVHHVAMGTAIRIANTIDFDAGSGRLATPST